MLRVLKWLVALILTVTVGFGAVVLLTMYDELTKTLPTIDRLLEYDPPVATRVYAADGSLIEEFYRERRYRVPIAEIPPLVRNAFLAAEDSDFFAHRGVDFIGILRAMVANLRAGDVVQGASTITQQVVKALLLTPERSYERKAKEILLSLRLEQHLTKEQILELYLNQIYFGDGNHGVGAAARNYFGKSVQELTAAEAALLAGLPAAPSRYSPNRDPEAATTRQHYVLRRMLEEHFLSAGEYQAAMRETVQVLARHQKVSSVRNYYTETVRLQLETMFGAEAPYNQGYTVHTSMQPRLQSLAELAVRNGIERIDGALGYRGPKSHPSDQEARDTVARTKGDIGDDPLDPERIYEAVVTRVAPGKLDVTVGPFSSTVDVSAVHWSGRAKSRTFRAGDVIEVRTREPAHVVSAKTAKAALAKTASAEAAKKPDAAATPAAAQAGGATLPVAEKTVEPPHFYLAQTPEIEAALIVIDMQDGGIAALVGGYDFLASQFNRALQAERQPGSAFKPFVYAAALDHGFTAASILQDTPVEFMDNDKLWQPRNYTRDYKGPIRLRTALEQSRNVVSVKLVDAMGPKTVVDYLSRFHLSGHFGANLSLGLGTTEMTLRDLTEGYTAFANGGVKVEPVLIRSIEDKDGKSFFTDEPRRREALSPETASLMTYILRGVVERGTATSIKALERPVAGKTGTTNEQRDAWFIGYTPNLAVGVWVGFDDPNQTMGKMGTGGRVAAPIWLDFMKPALAGTPVRDFEMPEDINCVNIDPDSGKRAAEWTAAPFLECFKEGTEPGSPGEEDSTPPASPSEVRVYRPPGDAGSPPATGAGDPLGAVPLDEDGFPIERTPPNAGDPRWPSERNPETPTRDRWASSPAPVPTDPYGRPLPGGVATDPYGRPLPPEPATDPYGRPLPEPATDPYGRPLPGAATDPYGRALPGDGAATEPYGRALPRDADGRPLRGAGVPTDADGRPLPRVRTDPYGRPMPEHLSARPVETRSGTEVRLYRDSEGRDPATDEAPPPPPPSEESARPSGRLWGTAPIEPPPAAREDNGIRLFPNTGQARRD
ncbi:MAG TPA: PBP1A family penicillin-binding protein [Candidatus Limnocylindrales bacterium]|nr:PBP1A family penicillin-binding protein [Candidatus Limnocylindrales bacterium]